jgi:hypothetical protein
MMDSYPSACTVEDAYAMRAAAGCPPKHRASFSAGGDLTNYYLLLSAKIFQGQFEVDRETISNLEENDVGWDDEQAVYVEKICRHRRFITNERAYIGLAAGLTEGGDQVCVLFGGDSPFILRSVSNHYKLIGPSYIHGIMKGEVIERFKSGELLEEWFEIH